MLVGKFDRLIGCLQYSGRCGGCLLKYGKQQVSMSHSNVLLFSMDPRFIPGQTFGKIDNVANVNSTYRTPFVVVRVLPALPGVLPYFGAILLPVDASPVLSSRILPASFSS